MKIKSNKKVISILLGVSFISLASIGFASWVINNPTNTGANATINVQIGEIDDASLTAKITDDTDLKNPIRFDSLDKVSCTGEFITNGEATTENLDVTFTYTVTGKTALNTGKYKVSYAFSGDAVALKEKIGGTIDGSIDETKQYIDTTCLTDCEITLPGDDGSVAATNDSNIKNKVTYNKPEFTVATIETTIAFEWGKAFAEKNPCKIVSTDVSTDGEGFTAGKIKSTLEAFETAYRSVKGGNGNPEITLTITPSKGE